MRLASQIIPASRRGRLRVMLGRRGLSSTGLHSRTIDSVRDGPALVQ
jgi:hypothetical protein